MRTEGDKGAVPRMGGRAGGGRRAAEWASQRAPEAATGRRGNCCCGRRQVEETFRQEFYAAC